MTTPWVRRHLEDATALRDEGRDRSALSLLLAVLSVYPDSGEALALAADLVYYGMVRTHAASTAEPLSDRELRDPRLDRLFCSCDWPDCQSWWAVHPRMWDRDAAVVVSNPVGGRCEACGGYWCRRHFADRSLGETVALIGCPRCGSGLKAAPPNGRPRLQTPRRNQLLVHAHVLREGLAPIKPSYLETFFDTLAPEVFEDDASITTDTVQPWPSPDDVQVSALASLDRARPEYATQSYDLYVFPCQGRGGERMALVKVYAKSPKHVDPDKPSEVSRRPTGH